MKKIIKTTSLVTFIGVLLFLGYQIVSKINHKNEIAQNIKRIPEFSYQNIDGIAFTNKNLREKTSTIFIYFNTECDFCHEEAKIIKENITRFSNVQFIFVSAEKPEQIKKFAQKHQLTTYDTVYFLHDNKNTFATTFDVNALPCLVLYDKNNTLIEKIKGQTKVEILIKKINIE
ncbi:TlpA family protein disulfide reductase [Flavobacterium pectinovorum]|uniref:Thioredoxin domain-containing protein n=1 Tax=Flavobacterium pectinovorum TaxID=29533 RepID=A0A502EP74_9FLAO|nr:redoxin domain-containing protein [Flavobacterium pectinovorum]TPG38842.1 hypothetical protein EAH81_15300 [Flavobacterium pectinovorum]